MPGLGSTRSRGFGPLQWLIAAAFVLAAAFTVYKIFRLTGAVRDWDRTEEIGIRPWMRPRRVARIHRVPVEMVNEAIGLPANARDRRSIAEIAASQNRSFADLRQALENKLIENKVLGPSPPRLEGPP